MNVCGLRHAISLPRTAHELAHPHALAHAAREPLADFSGGPEMFGHDHDHGHVYGHDHVYGCLYGPVAHVPRE